MIDAIKRLPPIPGAAGIDRIQQPTAPGAKPSAAAADFAEVLDKQLTQKSPLSFSAHAQSRLNSRSISLNTQQLARLQQGVDQAAQKGAKDSLVVMDNLAFIVSVKNRTVVTAVDGAAQQGNVFTQIDSAVIV